MDDNTVYPHWIPAFRAARQRAIDAKTWDPDTKPARPPSELHPLVQLDRLIQQASAPDEALRSEVVRNSCDEKVGIVVPAAGDPA